MPKEPSRPTVKRLFGLSGNCCAFTDCPTKLIDPSGSVVGQVCHIKGEKPGAARYDASQSDEERHDFDNLILLCNIHHKVIDDDEATFTAEKLKQLREEHGIRQACRVPIDAATTERFVNAVVNGPMHGSVIHSVNQSGGQTAHQITNYYRTGPNDDAVDVEGTLKGTGSAGGRSRFGCVGLELMVVCRSVRPAKIRAAHLYIMNVNVLSKFQQGFGSDFGHSPVAGAQEAMVSELLAVSPRNSPEGFLLNRDDVCRFFYPLPVPTTKLALAAKPQDLAVTVEFFDESERTLIEGEAIQGPLKDMMAMYGARPGRFNGTATFVVRALSQKLGSADAAGTVNSTPITF